MRSSATSITTTDFEQVKDADLVIEAISEDMEVKKETLAHSMLYLTAQCHHCHQHFISLNYRFAAATHRPGQGDRYTSLQPRTRHETGRGLPQVN